MSRDTTTQTSTERGTHDLTFTRRAAMSLLGAGAAAGVSGAATARQEGDGEGDGKGNGNGNGNGNGDGNGNGKGNGNGGGDATRKWNQHVDAQDHDLRNVGEFDAGGATLDHVRTAARDADVIVWKDEEGTFHADSTDETVASGEALIEVVNAALDSLTDGRTTKEKVAVVSPGTVGPADEMTQISVPSYTVLDVPATITVENEDEPFVIPVRMQDVEHVEIPNLSVEGGPRYGILGNSVSNVRIGRVDMRLNGTGLGVRIDQYGENGRSRDVTIESGYVESSGHHAFELNGVTRADIGRLVANDPANAGLNMDHTIDASVGSVVGFDPGHPSTYATFRLANFCHNVAVGRVVSRGGAKGVMLITSRNVSIGGMNVVGATDSGVFVTLSANVSFNGGVVKNCHGEAIRIHGYPRDEFDWDLPTEGITVSNVRLLDDRPEGEKTQTHAIRESGPTAFNNQFVHNDVRGGGTEELIAVNSASTVVADNVGGGVASGTVTLESGSDVAARVPDVSDHGDVTLDLRAKPVEAPGGRCAWDEYFEWNPEAEAWELVVEWRTDPGESVDLDYVVDRPQANLDRRGYRGNWDEYVTEGPEDPHVDTSSL